MQTIRYGQVSHRTSLMTLEHARSFSRCLLANFRFSVLEIGQSVRAKGDASWFVRFAPTNPERIAAMVAAQQDARDERAAAQAFLVVPDGDAAWIYNLTNETGPYRTTEHSCSCPDERFAKCPGGCKHQRHLRAVNAATLADVAEDAAEFIAEADRAA